MTVNSHSQQRLDKLAQAGLPIWVTELDVMSQDENKRADFLETALRALYGHPSVEGILLWGFWDQSHWRGEKAALVKGDNLEARIHPVTPLSCCRLLRLLQEILYLSLIHI